MRAALRAVAAGLPRVFGSARLLALLLACNLALSLLALLPLAHEMDGLLSFQGTESGLVRSWPAWLDADLRAHGAGALEAMDLQAAAVILLATALGAFLSAGAMGVLHDGDGAFSAGTFFRGCGRYGFPFLRLMVLTLAGCWLVDWLLARQLGAVVAWLSFDWPSLRGAEIMRLAYEGLVVAGFLSVVWTADLARARMVVEKRRSALGGLLSAVALAARRAPSMAMLFGILAALEGLALLVAGSLLPRIAGGTWTRLGLLAVAVEMLVAVRLGLRVARMECARRWLLDEG